MEKERFVKKVLLGGVLSLVFFGVGHARAERVVVSTSTVIVNKAFQVGEKLRYTIEWGALDVGSASLEIPDSVEVSSRPAYHLFSMANSKGFVENFYKVRDRNEAFLDMKSFESHGYKKAMREGGFRREEEVVFDLTERKFRGRSRNPEKMDKPPSEYVGDLPAFALDVFSSLYLVRTMDLKEGLEIVIDVNSKKNWPLLVKIQKRETVKVPAGTFDCFLVEPVLRDEGIFIKKGKKLEVWMTADERKMPVLMRSKVFIGAVEAKLTEFSKP